MADVHPDDLDDGIEVEDVSFDDQPTPLGDDQPILDEVEINDNISDVASKPGKNALVLIGLTIASVIFLYHMIFKEDDNEKQEKALQEVIASQPVENAQTATQQTELPNIDIGIIDTPEIPDIGNLEPPPDIVAETPNLDVADPFANLDAIPIAPEPIPEPAPPVQDIAVIPPSPAPQVVQEQPAPAPVVEENEEEKTIAETPNIENAEPTPQELARLRARRRANMLVINGGGDIDPPKKEKNEDASGRDSSAEQTTATYAGNLNYMIAQGKMMNAVLETAINTDLPGTLRAVVSRDVYAESGKNILIPKGSRLIGSYANNISKGQRRLFITWGRVLRPDGIDINIGSPGTDRLGRAGVTGNVDNRYFEIFSNSLLLSAISIAGAITLEEVTDATSATNSSTTTSDGTTTNAQTGTPSDFAILEAVSDLNEISKNIAEGYLGIQPTITIDQGTIIKVFVNKDLIFPPETLKENVRFIR